MYSGLYTLDLQRFSMSISPCLGAFLTLMNDIRIGCMAKGVVLDGCSVLAKARVNGRIV
jgi:hypothetical protein